MNWLLRFSVVSFCLVLGACGSNDGGKPPVDVQKDGGAWTKFRSPDGQFAVLFPGTAQKLPSSEQGEVSYAVELEKGGGYTVMYSEIDEVDPKEIEDRLTKIRNDVVASQKVLLDETPTVAGRPARDFAFVDEGGDAQFYRVLIAGTRLYQVMMVTDGDKFASASDRKKYVDSFELIK